MPIKQAGGRASQTGIISSTEAADRTILLRPQTKASITLELTNNTGLSTGAKLEVTNSTEADIAAGTAVWVNPPESINKTTTHMLVTPGDECQLTGVRAVVTDATWSLHVLQK